MQATVGGNVRYPNLQSIADLFRASINDTMNNSDGGGFATGNSSGLIMQNLNPDLLRFMDSAIRELYSDLRNVGDPELILDNYILTGLPALTKTDPAVQVSIGYMGYFDGFQWHPQWTLPISTSKVLQLWEKQSGTGDSFFPMTQAPFALPGCQQGQMMRIWEMRQGQIWMPGCLQSVDIRMRVRITYPDFIDPKNINFASAYVPIVDCGNAIVAKMLILYARRFDPSLYQMAIADEKRLMDKILLEVVRQMQSQENQRTEFGGEAVQDFAISWSWL